MSGCAVSMQILGVGPLIAHALVTAIGVTLGASEPGATSNAALDRADAIDQQQRARKPASVATSAAMAITASDGSWCWGPPIWHVMPRPGRLRRAPGCLGVMARRPVKVAMIAQAAARPARILLWALMPAQGEHYRASIARSVGRGGPCTRTEARSTSLRRQTGQDWTRTLCSVIAPFKSNGRNAGNLVRVTPSGPGNGRFIRPHKQAGYMIAPDRYADVAKASCQTGAVHT